MFLLNLLGIEIVAKNHIGILTINDQKNYYELRSRQEMAQGSTEPVGILQSVVKEQAYAAMEPVVHAA